MACIVSAYYKIPSKQSHEWYIPHLLRWFRSCGRQDNTHFFTTEEIREELASLTYISHVQFHILPFEELTAMDLGQEFWDLQYARDSERYHSAKLGMIWYEKRHFIRRIMDLQPEINSFIWCDAACIRNDDCERAAKDLGQRIQVYEKGRMYLQCIRSIPLKQFFKHPDVFISCGLLAGDRSAWKEYTDLYEKTLSEYTKEGISTISDQYITASCITKKSELFLLCLQEGTIDIWFKFLELL
jgi:hypothetical protein